MKRFILSLLVMLNVSSLVRADVTLFDDPAQVTHPRILNFSAVAATQTSIPFGNFNFTSAAMEVRLVTCTTCNVTVQIFASGLGAGSSDYLVCADAAALTAAGTYIYTFGTGTDAVNAPTGSSAPFGIRLNCNRRLPPLWYVVLLWNSGTTMTGSVIGWGY